MGQEKERGEKKRPWYWTVFLPDTDSFDGCLIFVLNVVEKKNTVVLFLSKLVGVSLKLLALRTEIFCTVFSNSFIIVTNINNLENVSLYENVSKIFVSLWFFNFIRYNLTQENFPIFFFFLACVASRQIDSPKRITLWFSFISIIVG